MTAVDRRAFLARTAAVAAAAAAGAATLPTVAAWAGGPARFGSGAYMRPRPEALADPTELTLAEAAWMIRYGKLSPTELVEAYLARIGTFEPVYLAFNTVLADEARAAAKAAGRRRHTGPLHGIPLAIKDNYWTKGVRTTANSYLFQDFVPPSDATAVARLKANGAVVLGKTQMGPLATTRATTPDGRITTVNAWTPTIPGTSATALARKAFLSAVDAIEGVRLVDVPLPDEWDLLTGGEFNNVRLPERSEPFMPYLRTDLRGFGVSVTGWLQGALLGANEFLTGQRAKLLLLERVLDQIFEHCDVVVQAGPVPFDILGLPEIGFPIGFTSAGVPIGTILGGEPYAEDRLLSVVAAYQAVTDWHWRRPANPPAAGPAALRSATGDRGRLSAEDVVAQME